MSVVIVEIDGKTCFLLDFTCGSLMFAFALFDVSLWKAPVFSVAVFDKQNLYSVLEAVKYDSSISILEIQAPNGKVMQIKNFINGNKFYVGVELCRGDNCAVYNIGKLST